jgi:hypothetical protein
LLLVDHFGQQLFVELKNVYGQLGVARLGHPKVRPFEHDIDDKQQ